VTGALILNPTASLVKDWQRKGRVLRVCKGKDVAHILDYVNNTKRHGLPTDPVQWTLDGIERHKGASLKVCFGCKSSIPNSSARCPICGRTFSAEKTALTATQLPIEAMSLRDIQLIELTQDKRREFRLEAESRARTLEDFKGIAKAMGYKDKWAEYRFRELRG
jgi:superfamily II DNA or RNA helicase